MVGCIQGAPCFCPITTGISSSRPELVCLSRLWRWMPIRSRTSGGFFICKLLKIKYHIGSKQWIRARTQLKWKFCCFYQIETQPMIGELLGTLGTNRKYAGETGYRTPKRLRTTALADQFHTRNETSNLLAVLTSCSQLVITSDKSHWCCFLSGVENRSADSPEWQAGLGCLAAVKGADRSPHPQGTHPPPVLLQPPLTHIRLGSH